MKTMPTGQSSWVILLAGVSLLCSGVDGFGQGASAPEPAAPTVVERASAAPRYVGYPPKPEPIRFSEAIEQKRIEVRFEHFPLPDVVLWLEKSFPEVNFVLPRSVAEVNPEVFLHLRSAGLHDILEAIDIATDGLVVSEVRSPTLVALRLRTDPAPGAASYSLPPPSSGMMPGAPGPTAPDPDVRKRFLQRYGVDLGAGGGGGMVGGMGGGMGGVGFSSGTKNQEQPGKASEAPRAGQPAGPIPGRYGGVGLMMGAGPQAAPLSYQVMNLREILRMNEPKKIREALEMVEKITMQTLQTMAGDSAELQQRLRIKSFDFHEGSGVLVIIGQEDAIKLAMDVIRNLRTRELASPPAGEGAEKAENPK